MAFSIFLTIFNSHTILSQLFFHYLCKKEYMCMSNILYITKKKKAYLEPLPQYVREIFCRFLKQNHMYIQFFAKNIQPFPIHIQPSFRTLTPYHCLIATAFSWTSTKEGWDFWANMDTKWVNTCKQESNDPTISILIKSQLL